MMFIRNALGLIALLCFGLVFVVVLVLDEIITDNQPRARWKP